MPCHSFWYIWLVGCPWKRSVRSVTYFYNRTPHFFSFFISEWPWSDCAGMAYVFGMCGGVSSGINRVSRSISVAMPSVPQEVKRMPNNHIANKPHATPASTMCSFWKVSLWYSLPRWEGDLGVILGGTLHTTRQETKSWSSSSSSLTFKSHRNFISWKASVFSSDTFLDL